MSAAGSRPHLLVAFWGLQGEFGDQFLEAGVLVLEPGLALRLLRNLKRLWRSRKKLIARLAILCLADVVVLTDRHHQFALEAFEHAGGVGLRVPLTALHG